METIWIGLFLSFFVKGLVDAQFVRKYRDVAFPTDYPGFLDNSLPFSFERRFDFTSRDPFFKSWWTPDLSVFAEFPLTVQPRVQVFCDDSKLTLLIDKKSFGLEWTEGEMQLGDGCYPNGELPFQYVFSYSYDQCGTLSTIQNGQKILTNSLQLQPKTLPNLWQIPPSVHVSCTRKRLKRDPSFPLKPIDNGKLFHITIMTSSWLDIAKPHTYKRGQVVDVLVGAEIGPGQQLFVQSCFVSESPEPQTRPRRAVIFNKGCATSDGSYPVVKFLGSNGADVVMFSLNTSSLFPQLYIHCSVLVSDHGVTYGSKSCNYNVLQSRWEELGGDVDVCNCCRSKCKGSSSKNRPGSKVIVSSNLLVIEDVEHSPKILPSETRNGNIPLISNPSNDEPTEDFIPFGAFFSRSDIKSPQNDIVAIHQNPHSRKTIWLPGQKQSAHQENTLDSKSEDKTAVKLLPSEDVAYTPERRPSPVQQDSSLDLKGDLSLWDLSLLTMVDGWPIPQKPDFSVITENFNRNDQLNYSGENGEQAQVDIQAPADINYLILVGNQTPSEAGDAIPTEEPQRKKWESNVLDGNDGDFNDFRPKENLAEMHKDDVFEVKPIIRSKVQFSTGMDGFKMLIYEEEVENGKRFNKDTRREKEIGLKGLYSTFLNLLRRMDKAE
ncbi:zona pellucida protein C [Gouania willdenowi]|uniref:zona pellucida protein C n=1 Tax=Gouania willdenowi TaxID=441366 RepID=UPI001055E8AD|nr:uncharacterized protein LOC114456684 [Gouania willdenowi]